MRRRGDGDWERRVREVTWQLQQLTGLPARQVLLDALEHRLAVLTGPVTPSERVQAIVERLAATHGEPSQRNAPSAVEHAKALGYDKEGI